MSGEENLKNIVKNLKFELNEGEYVFCSDKDGDFDLKDALFTFNEKEGLTVVFKKEKADMLCLSYSYIASWITLSVHSSLNAVGLTALFSSALAKNGISCNVVAAYYHDHIFVSKGDCARSMEILNNISV